MMEWMESQVQALQFLWQNPSVLLLALVLLVPLYWVQGKFVRRATKNAHRARFGGLGRPATQAKRIHDIGIGVQTVLVLKPVKSGVVGVLFAMGFFGALAAFMGLVVLQEDEGQTTENYFAFAIGIGFVLLALWTLLGLFARIELDDYQITHKRLFRRKRIFRTTDIAAVEKFGKVLGAGVVLVFEDGRKLKIPANFAGYAQALKFLWTAHPSVAGHAMLAEVAEKQYRSGTMS